MKNIFLSAKQRLANIFKNKKLTTTIIILLGIIIIIGIIWQYFAPHRQSSLTSSDNSHQLSPLNCQYIVENQVVNLKMVKKNRFPLWQSKNDYRNCRQTLNWRFEFGWPR